MAKRSGNTLISIAMGFLAVVALYASAVQLDYWLLHTAAISNNIPNWLDRNVLVWAGIYANVFAVLLALIRLRLDTRSRRTVIILAAATALVAVEVSLPLALPKYGTPPCEPDVEMLRH